MRAWTNTLIVGSAVLSGLLAACTGQVASDVTAPGAGGGNTNVGSGGTANPTGGVVPGGAGGPASACVPGVPATSQLPRLTRVQYDNTVRDLFGITSQPSSMLAPDTVGSVDQRAWDGYRTAADTIATQVMANATSRARAIPCTPSGDGVACARQLVEQLGRRAFRRPLTSDESTRFLSLYMNRAQLTATGTFDEAAQLILRAFLVSPSFLTRAEIAETADGQNYALNGYEVASRLSYMLWGSMPDDALFTAAANGKLAAPAGILEEARRMLGDPKARARVSEFHRLYAHMGDGTRWAEMSRDPALYPAFKAAMTPLLSDETRRLFDHLVFERNGTFRDLLTTPVAFVNATLAPLYGLEPAKFGADLTAVELNPAQRPGVFTRAGFLAAYSLYDRPSPILRGAFLQKDVLCTDIPPPPPNVEGTPLPTTGKTNRERVDAQTAGAECATCHHNVINPTGFALEGFDAIGASRTTDNGAPVDTAANVMIGASSVAVAGAADLMNKIAASPQAQACYAKKWVQYAYERTLTTQDQCTVQELAGKLTQNGYTVLNLIADLTQSQSFRLRAKDVAP